MNRKLIGFLLDYRNEYTKWEAIGGGGYYVIKTFEERFVSSTQPPTDGDLVILDQRNHPRNRKFFKTLDSIAHYTNENGCTETSKKMLLYGRHIIKVINENSVEQFEGEEDILKLLKKQHPYKPPTPQRQSVSEA